VSAVNFFMVLFSFVPSSGCEKFNSFHATTAFHWGSVDPRKRTAKHQSDR